MVLVAICQRLCLPTASRWVVKKLEHQIVAAIDRAAGHVQPALVGEGCALGENSCGHGTNGTKHSQDKRALREEESAGDFSFHGGRGGSCAANLPSS